MKNILFLAAPGAGKGTQSDILAEKFGLIHLSSGDLLRLEVASSSELSEKIKEIMFKGELVPDEMMIEMVKNQLESKPNAAGFIFDGFPRTANQAKALDEMLAEKNYPLNLVIILEIEPGEMVKRLLKRAEIEGRHDDNEETIKNRISVYDNQTKPLIDYYTAQSKTVVIDGSPEISVIAEEIEAIISKI